MKLWIDAQLSPSLASWLRTEFGLEAVSVRSLGLQFAEDTTIFHAAQKTGTVVLTKDRDFVHLVEKFGIPPQIIWLTCGNTSNSAVKIILKQALPQALNILSRGEHIVEIRNQHHP